MANLVFDFLHNYKTGERRESDPADAYQYDEGHVFEAVVPVAVTSCEIHYWARGFDEAEAYTPASITQNTDNSYTITGNIPNKFFETYGDLRVYIVVTDGDASITTYEGRIHICERSKPDDYVDDDPENEATRVLVEAQEAAATATQKAADAATSAEQAAESARTLTLDTTLTQSGQAADAKAAGDAINDLKEDLSNSLNLSNFEFAWGNVYNDSINTEKIRIHSVEMIWLPKGTKIKTSGNFANFGVARYNLDGSYAANGSWGMEYVAPEDCYGRIVMRKPSGEIAEEEFADLIGTLSIYYATTAETILYTKTASHDSKEVLTEELRETYGVFDAKNSANIGISNLFDKDASGVSRNGYYDRTNTFVSSSTLGTTDYIRVFQGFEYYTNLNAGFFALWYDSNKTFLRYTNVSGANVKFTPVTGAVYMRTLLMLSSIDTYTVKCDRIFASLASESPYADLNGVAFGTSLTYRAQSTGGYLQYLPTLCGASIENKGLGNSTILDNGSNPKMMDVITGYTNYASKDFAILEGFVNDWYNNAASLGTWKDTGTTTVCGCVRTALTHILTQNPSITLILVIDPIGKSASGVDCSSLATRNGLTQTEFYDEIAKVADTLGIPTIRVDRNSGMSELTPYMYIDNIHPNDEGAKQTANTIWSVMKNIPIKVIDS